MRDVNARLELTLALNAIEQRLEIAPDDVVLRYDRARCIQALGRAQDALLAYRDVLARDPGHVRAMNAFGLLLLEAGEQADAETVFAEAATRHPRDAESHANLAFTRARRGDLPSARAHYENALRLEPDLAIAHHGLATVLERLGEHERAREHRALGLAHRPLTELRYRGRGTPTRVLVVGTAADGNLVTTRLLDDRVFLTYALVVEHYDPAQPLPPHDVVFNVIGEADACAPQLAAAQALLRTTDAPILNPPSAVLATTREAIARRMAALEEVVAPAVVRLTRAQLAAPDALATLAAHDIRAPFLLRTPGHHGGEHFEQVGTDEALPDALATLPGEELLAIAFLDARDAAGTVRKYRAMIVDGALYPLHLALGSRWKLHYFSADMIDAPAHRAADAAFLADLPTALGPRATAALERVRGALGLDYAGVDFGVDREGRLLLFEANATMVVPAHDPKPAFTYRRAAVERILAAVRTMLLRRARRPAGTEIQPRNG